MYCWSEFRLYRCGACQTESIDPIPTAEELNAFYQSISKKKMARWQRRLHLVERAFEYYLRDYQDSHGRRIPERLLDIGGGVGYYVRAALNRNIDAWLMDCAGDALEFARNVLGITSIVQGDIQRCADALDENSFDFVLARHTIEHVRDPELFVAQIAKVTRLHGLLQIETPNVESREQWCHLAVAVQTYRIIRASNPSLTVMGSMRRAISKSMSGVNPPKHLWGFTEIGLRLILERAGFKILRVTQAVAGDRVYDPLYFDLHRLGARRGLGIPYYLWERALSPLFQGRGMNLAILAQLDR